MQSPPRQSEAQGAPNRHAIGRRQRGRPPPPKLAPRGNRLRTESRRAQGERAIPVRRSFRRISGKRSEVPTRVSPPECAAEPTQSWQRAPVARTVGNLVPCSSKLHSANPPLNRPQNRLVSPHNSPVEKDMRPLFKYAPVLDAVRDVKGKGRASADGGNALGLDLGVETSEGWSHKRLSSKQKSLLRRTSASSSSSKRASIVASSLSQRQGSRTAS